MYTPVSLEMLGQRIKLKNTRKQNFAPLLSKKQISHHIMDWVPDLHRPRCPLAARRRTLRLKLDVIVARTDVRVRRNLLYAGQRVISSISEINRVSSITRILHG